MLEEKIKKFLRDITKAYPIQWPCNHLAPGCCKECHQILRDKDPINRAFKDLLEDFKYQGRNCDCSGPEAYQRVIRQIVDLLQRYNL